MKMVGNIKGIFVGHDHNNDYWGDYNGIKLHFGRKTGHGGYGPPWYMRRGARVIQFLADDDGNVEMNSWIREENGKQVIQQPKYPFWISRWFPQIACDGEKRHEQFFKATGMNLSFVNISSFLSFLDQSMRKMLSMPIEYMY